MKIFSLFLFMGIALNGCNLAHDNSGLAAENSAGFKPCAVIPVAVAAASSVLGGNTAAMSCDGNAGTRWESAQGVDPQWISWDLGSSKALSSIIIDWEAAAASNYTIQGSADGAAWTVLATVVNTKYMVNHTIITNSLTGSYRYVRMYGTTRTTGYGYSIWEVTINASDTASSTAVSSSSAPASSVSSVSGIALASILSASASTVLGTQTAAMSCDKNTGTRWESTQGVDPQWIMWDLGSSKALNSIIIDWEAAAASNYTIQGSADGAAWTVLATVVNTKYMVNHTVITNSLTGSYRYVRMYGTTRTTGYGYSIWETSIYINGTSTSSVATASSVTAISSSSVGAVSSSSIAAASSSSASGAFTDVRVLFVGNSYTYYNESYNILRGLASNININIIIGQAITGGQTLAYHWANVSANGSPPASNQIADGAYNYVVLQDYSTTAWDDVARTNFEQTWAPRYANFIKSKGGIPVFYMTWANKTNMENMSDTTQDKVSYMYSNTAKLLSSKCAPAGNAWRKYIKDYGTATNLYQPDFKHPTVYASYMVGCMYFATIFNRSPIGNAFRTVKNETGYPSTSTTFVTMTSNEAAVFQTEVWQTYQAHMSYIGGQ